MNNQLLLSNATRECGFSSTLAIRNAGESSEMKVITLNKLTAKRKVKCLEIPHYA